LRASSASLCCCAFPGLSATLLIAFLGLFRFRFCLQNVVHPPSWCCVGVPLAFTFQLSQRATPTLDPSIRLTSEIEQ
jgi:hypothetical protein